MAACSDLSASLRVPSSGSFLRVSIMTEYDFATLNLMLGMSSVTSLSKIGRMEVSIIFRLMTGARV